MNEQQSNKIKQNIDQAEDVISALSNLACTLDNEAEAERIGLWKLSLERMIRDRWSKLEGGQL